MNEIKKSNCFWGIALQARWSQCHKWIIIVGCGSLYALLSRIYHRFSKYFGSGELLGHSSCVIKFDILFLQHLVFGGQGEVSSNLEQTKRVLDIKSTFVRRSWQLFFLSIENGFLFFLKKFIHRIIRQNNQNWWITTDIIR